VGHDFWGFKEGAPLFTQAIAQTTDGFLWFATPTGLYRFDGNRFELFHSRFREQLSSTNVEALIAPVSGGLWIGYAFGGFSFLKDGKVTNYARELASPTGSVINFAQNGSGALWAATSSGLWKFDNSRWQHIGPESNLPAGGIREVRFDQDGTLWALLGPMISEQATKLAYLRPTSSQFQRAESNLQVTGFTLDPDERVVTSPEAKQLFKKSNGNSVDLPSAFPVLRKASNQFIDRTQSVWILLEESTVLRVGASGAVDIPNKDFAHNAETYKLNPQRNAKLVDREGNIWFGEQSGIHRFFYSPLIKQELPQSKGPFYIVTADDQGAVWITAGGDNTKLFHVKNSQVDSHKFAGSGNLGFTYRSPDKTIWFGRTTSLWHFVNGSLMQVELPKEMADRGAYLQTITQDRRGGMWVSFGRHGLYRLADGVWTSYGGRDDLPKTGVVIEFTDSLGRVWFG
jgi:ligand-binding sensor domain-containing protein